MRPVSDGFLSALRGSHRATVQAFVVAPGQVGVAPTGTEITVLSGDVQMDAKAAIRSTIDMTTDGTGSFPDNASDALAPYGNELFVRRGIAFGGGSVEWVSLGYFRISAVGQDDAPNGPIQISGQDRMVGIVDARLLAPIQFGSTETFGDVVNQLVTEVYPWATIEWDDETETDPIARTVIAEEDRHKFLDELVTSRGKTWFWDHRGILVIRDVPDPVDVVWEANAGANGVLVQMSRELSREGVYNAVVATGEALDTTTPPRAVAYDDNPDSPTYWDGDFGKVPRFYSSPFITTDSQAGTAAASILRQNLGLPYSVDFTQVPNPALEPWDPVAINLAGTMRTPRRVAWDSYSRTSVDTWGSADSGQLWLYTGTESDFDVSGGVGTVAIPVANNTKLAVLDGVNESDVEGTFVASVPVAATGASLVFSAIARYSFSGGHNAYMFRLEFNAAGDVTVKISKYTAGSLSELGSVNPIPGTTYTADQRWVCRFQAVGTALKIKVWPEDDPEPVSWTLSTTDSDHTSGSVGMWFWRVASNTNTSAQFHVDDLEVKTQPGISPGAEVHVIDSIAIPLMVTQPQTATTREQTLVVIGEA